MTGEKKFAKYATDLKTALAFLNEQNEKSLKKAVTILTKMRTHALKMGGLSDDGSKVDKKPKARSEYQNFQQKASNRELAKRQIEARGQVPSPTLMMKEIAIMWKESGLSKASSGEKKPAAKTKPKAKPKKTNSSSSIGSKGSKKETKAATTKATKTKKAPSSSDKPKAKKAKA